MITRRYLLFMYNSCLLLDPWSSDSDLSDLSPIEDEYAKVDKSDKKPREAPDIGDVTATTASEVKPQANVTTSSVTSYANVVSTTSYANVTASSYVNVINNNIPSTGSVPLTTNSVSHITSTVVATPAVVTDTP